MKNMSKKLLVMIIVCLLAIVSGPVSAAPAAASEEQPRLTFNVYLKLDGIAGESTASRYAKWIELSDVQFDVSNTPRNAAGSGSGSGKANLNHFGIAKIFDASSIPLFQASLSGSTIKNGQIAFVTQGKSPQPFLTIDLEKITISEYSFNDGYESIGLKFGSIRMKYSTVNSAGTPSITGGWDFSQYSPIK